MALTKAQVSLVTVATLGITPGAYTAQLQAFNTQKEAAAFIATTGLLNEGTNAEFVNTVVSNLGVTATSEQKAAFYKALEGGVSRADAAVDFANTMLVENGSLAQVNKAIASTSTSADLTVLKAELGDASTDGLRVKFNDKNKDQSDGVTGGHDVYNIGKAQIDAGQSKISVDYTFELKNQIGEDATYTGNFLSPILEEKPAKTSGSQVVLELRNLREGENSLTPLKDLPTNGFGFEIDGELVFVQSTAIDEAETYASLLAAIQARVTELASGQNLPEGADAALYAKLATFTVEFGNTKFAEERNADGEITKTHDVQVTEIILTDDAGATLNPRGYTNRDGIIDSSGFTLFAQMSDESGTSIQNKIATNLEADNVGYGSQGATVNLVGQSASDKGIQELNVTANNNVWFTKLASQKNENTTNHLEIINLVAGSEGYFRVGTQKNDPTHLAALVDEDFSKAGLVDVQQLNAANAGSVAVNSYITDAVIKRFDLEDTGLYTTDDKDALIQYNLTGGNDVLQIKIDSEVVAYADAVVNINAGAGNDFVHLQIDQGHTYGDSWLANQQLNDNINITAASGNNTIWTEGAGNANITTGGGADTILADNSGKSVIDFTTDPIAYAKLVALGATEEGVAYDPVTGAQTAGTIGLNGLVAFNAASAKLGDIVSDSTNGLGNPATTAPQTFNTFKNTLQVTYKGFESAFVKVDYNTTKFTTNTQQINQAIKKAIADDAVLSKLIVAKEFPGNVLVIESLIDGVVDPTELDISFVAPVVTTASVPAVEGEQIITAAEATRAEDAHSVPGTAGATVDNAFLTGATTALEAIYGTNGVLVEDDNSNGIAGANSTEESDNVINAGGGNDVIVLGTGQYSQDTVVLEGNFGHNTIVNFTTGATLNGATAADQGADFLDFTAYLDGASTSAAPGTAVSLVTGAASLAANAVATVDLEDLLANITATHITDFVSANKSLSSISTSDWVKILNDSGFDTVTGSVTKNVILVQNTTTAGTQANENAGEYLVLETTGKSADGDFASVKVVGTLDFGDAGLTGLVGANLADFA